MKSSDLPKETISVNEATLYGVCKKINDHLNLHIKRGWTVGNATAGINNINQYELSKGQEQMVVAFDVSPSARYIAGDLISFTMVSTLMGKPNADKILFELQDREKQKKMRLWTDKYLPYIPIGLIIVVGLILSTCHGKT